MVLRQNSEVNMWGFAGAGSRIAISPDWCDSTFSAVCDSDGKWKAVVSTPAGSMMPHRVRITETDFREASDSITLDNILIGEVWFCSGQSNMEMPLDGFWDCPVEGSAEEIALSGKHDGIRMVTIPKTGALSPQSTVGGFLWYQGETNVGRHDTYAARLQALAAHWRGLWGQGELPFYLVELAPYRYGESNDGNRKGGISGALLREAQFEAARSIPNSGIVCTNDLAYPYEDIQIHPCRKKEVGQRLAWLALNRTYGFGSIDCEGPVFREMEIIGNEAVLRFDNDRNGFSPWHDLEGFEIAGENRIFYEAEAVVVPGQKCVKVSSEAVDRPVAVRYCFRDFCPGNLTGSRNLPAFPFRTDDWQ